MSTDPNAITDSRVAHQSLFRIDSCYAARICSGWGIEGGRRRRRDGSIYSAADPRPCQHHARKIKSRRTGSSPALVPWERQPHATGCRTLDLRYYWPLLLHWNDVRHMKILATGPRRRSAADQMSAPRTRRRRWFVLHARPGCSAVNSRDMMGARVQPQTKVCGVAAVLGRAYPPNAIDLTAQNGSARILGRCVALVRACAVGHSIPLHDANDSDGQDIVWR